MRARLKARFLSVLPHHDDPIHPKFAQASLVAKLTGPSAFSALFPEYGYTGPFRGVYMSYIVVLKQ